MREEELKFIAVSPKEHIRFKCIGCGACCKNIRFAISYRMSKKSLSRGIGTKKPEKSLELLSK